MSKRIRGSISGNLFVSLLAFGVLLVSASPAWAPCFEVVKTCTDANAPGEPIRFDGYVRNCNWNLPLFNVSAVDNRTGALTLERTTLQPMESLYFSGSYYPDASPSTNVVTATAQYNKLDGTVGTVTASASATCTVPEGIGCRVTGGGNDTAGMDALGQYDGTLALGKDRGGNGQFNRYTFGGQAGAFTAMAPQPYGEWTHHQQSGPSGRFVFHAGTASAPPATEIDAIICSDPGGCRPSGDPPSPAKQIDFSGTGTFRNFDSADPLLASVIAGETYHWFEVHIEDLGEPGNGNRFYNAQGCPAEGSGTDAFALPPVFAAPALCECPDYYRIRIFEAYNPAVSAPDKTNIIYQVSGYIDGGNLQIHYPTGYDLK